MRRYSDPSIKEFTFRILLDMHLMEKTPDGDRKKMLERNITRNSKYIIDKCIEMYKNEYKEKFHKLPAALEMPSLHSFFDPLLKTKDFTQWKYPRAYTTWCRKDSKFKIECLYITIGWEDAYRIATNSNATNNELLEYLEPYLLKDSNGNVILKRKYNNKRYTVIAIMKDKFMSA